MFFLEMRARLATYSLNTAGYSLLPKEYWGEGPQFNYGPVKLEALSTVCCVKRISGNY